MLSLAILSLAILSLASAALATLFIASAPSPSRLRAGLAEHLTTQRLI